MIQMSQTKLFGTSGIRGEAETLLTDQFCFDLGRTFALFLTNHNTPGWIAIGMDPRDSSPRIKAATIAGLLYEGREVFDEGVSPIPAINWILKVEPRFAGSIMITGSHIKAHLNGLKFFAFGEEILKDHEEEITSIYTAEKDKVAASLAAKKIEELPIVESRARLSYVEYLLEHAKTLPSWKIVVDPGNGAQSEVMPEVFKTLGLKVIEMNTDIQKTFLSRDTEVEGDFLDLQKKVLEEHADIGIGYDSDGDRVIFIDENGEFVPGDVSGTLIAKKLGDDKVVTPVNTSHIIDMVGLEVIRTKVGSPYVVQKLNDLNIAFGFEANGGGFFPEMRSRDGGRSSIEFLNLLAENNKKVSKLVAELPKLYLFRDKVEYKWELKDKILSEAKKEFGSIREDETDGLKIWLNDTTWILFRSSMNAPEFRVFAESDDEKTAKDLLNKGMEFVKKWI